MTQPGPERATAKRIEFKRHIAELYPLPQHLEIALGPLSIEGSKRWWEVKARRWKRLRIIMSLSSAMLEGDV